MITILLAVLETLALGIAMYWFAVSFLVMY